MATVEMGRERRTKSRTTREVRGDRSGLKIETRFCPENVADPFDTVQWEVRSAAIKDESGKALFEQTNCEIPSTWSQLATNVVVETLLRSPSHTRPRPARLPHRISRV